MGRVEQLGEVAFAEATLLTFAAAVDDEPVDQVAAVTGPVADPTCARAFLPRATDTVSTA
jgi:hypothetical protein